MNIKFIRVPFKKNINDQKIFANLELKAIMIEYELDAFLTHCQNKKGCNCIGPLARERLRKTKNINKPKHKHLGTKKNTFLGSGSNQVIRLPGKKGFFKMHL